MMEGQDTTGAARKLRVLMVCAHEPSVDPRIRWEAESAANRFDVTVLGFKTRESDPDIDTAGAYRTIRLWRTDRDPLSYLWSLLSTTPKSLRIALAVVAVPVFPALVIAEILVRLLVAIFVALRSTLVTAALLRPLTSRLGQKLGLARIHYVKGLLRMQFAPATEIFWQYIKDMPEKPDVIHCNDLDTLLVGVLAKQHFGSRLVFDAHEFFPVADSLCAWIDTTFFSWVEWLLIRKVDAVVTVNPLLADAMRDAYRLARVYSVPNVEPWVDERPARSAASCMSELAGGRVRFLFQGRFTLARGIEEIVEAWAQVDGTKAALFLRGPDNPWRTRAMELAARLGLLDRSVYFLDSVSEDMLVSAAAEADVGIIPYLPIAINERLCCPNKLSQYLHAGLMVISNDLPYVRSVLDEAGAGIAYDSRDLSTLAAAVRQVVDDPDLLRRCKANALRFAREHFNWQVHGDILLRLYAGESPGQPARSRKQHAEAAASYDPVLLKAGSELRS